MGCISVVIPVYNRANVFEQSLASVINQTYRPLQIIVVDDGSTENIRSVFDAFEQKFSNQNCSFVYIRQENSGAPRARNQGLTQAVGEYIIFFDADVIAEREMLSTMREALEKDIDASFAYSNFLFGKKLFRGIEFSFDELKKKNYITTTSLIRKKDVAKWDESLKRFQDWDLWLTMVEQGKNGVWIDEVLFRVETGGTMSTWLPSFVYQAPFRWLPFFDERVRKYEQARLIIVRKHNI